MLGWYLRALWLSMHCRAPIARARTAVHGEYGLNSCGARPVPPSNLVAGGGNRATKARTEWTCGHSLFALVSAARSPWRSPASRPRPGNAQPAAAPGPAATAPARARKAVLDTYCVTCHNQRLRTAGLALDDLDVTRPGANAEVWERVIAQLRAGSMPPAGRPRPDAATYRRRGELARDATSIARGRRSPNPGRISAVHRLNRTEYNNAIRDLFALDLDVKSLLPGRRDRRRQLRQLRRRPHRFRRRTSSATCRSARQVTRLATGLPPTSPALETFEIPLHVVQDDRQSEDLPFGSRGGIAIRHDFPGRRRVSASRSGCAAVSGLPHGHGLAAAARRPARRQAAEAVHRRRRSAKGRPAAASYAGDGEPGFAGDPEWETYMQLGGDAGLEVRVPVEAGPRVVGVSFVRELWEPEGLPQPLQRGRVLTNDQIYMDYASVGSVQIGGPYQDGRRRRRTRRAAARSSSVSRRLRSDERACATKILSRMARLAYRRPVTNADVQTLLEFFDDGRRDGGSFDAGIQFALERMLVDPDFLLRVQRDPPARRRRRRPRIA